MLHRGRIGKLKERIAWIDRLYCICRRRFRLERVSPVAFLLVDRVRSKIKESIALVGLEIPRRRSKCRGALTRPAGLCEPPRPNDPRGSRHNGGSSEPRPRVKLGYRATTPRSWFRMRMVSSTF